MDEKFLLLSERAKHEILDYLPNNKAIEKLAIFFQNFSDGTRLKIISCLAMCDLCVPFRDKYGLTDLQTLMIARKEIGIPEIIDLFDKKLWEKRWRTNI